SGDGGWFSSGDDRIVLAASEGGEISGDDIDGNSGDDVIALVASEGGDIRVDDVDGGWGDDTIILAATDRRSDIRADDVDGGSGDDRIALYADGGDIRIDDIDGGSGDDDIIIAATDAEGSWISLDNIRGGSGDDLVVLSGLDNMNSNFFIGGEIDGGRGFDTLSVTNGSTLSLDDVERFQQLGVSEGSYLELTQRWVNFNGNSGIDGLVAVDATSYLRLSDINADLDTGTFVLEASQDGELGYRSIYTGADAGWLDQTGGVLDVSGTTATGLAYTQVELSDTEGSEPDPLLPDATFINQGTIALHSGLTVDGQSIDVAGDRLTINGDYVGGGNLLIDTYLGASDSPTDVLVINGNVAAESTTTIYVNNTNPGEGIYTGTGLGQGIKVVDVSESGVSPDDAFQLARNTVSGEREVMAGAFSYRLYQDPDNEMTFSRSSEDTGAGDWYLRAGYTAQATGYASAPSAMQRHFYAGLDTLHKRLGEVRQQDQLEGRNADLAQASVEKAPAYQPVPAPKFQMWGRGGGADLSYDVSGGWDFSQQTWGLQAGGDYTFDYNDWRITAGAFGGYGWSDVDVGGDWTSWGGSSSMDINGWNAGIYASIRQVGLVPGAGFYTDLVGKVDVLDLDIASSSNVTANTDATVWGGSIEMGYGFELSNGWVIQPQAQLAYASASQDSYYDSIGTYISPGDAESLIGRLGLQVQSTFVMETGQTITPYAIFNVNSEFLGDNKTNVAGTVLTSDINGTWFNAGLGFTADLNGSVALFGTGEYNFGDVQGWAGQGGVKFRW
ncbi:autotransporter outer membrane beta-barrel domain-containing protein, partial [Ancylobacter rudongensis]